MTPIVGLFLVALIEVALAVVVWLRNPGRAVNRWFAAFATTLAVWGTLVGVRRSLSRPGGGPRRGAGALGRRRRSSR